MAERVPKVKDGAVAGRFSLVLLHNRRLELAAACHNMSHHVWRTLFQTVQAVFQIRKEFRIQDDSILDDFRQASPVFAIRQRPQHIRVDQNSAGLPESPNHVLAAGQVNSDFPADAAVDLCQERRGNLKERNSPCKRGRDESSQVADHAAANGQHDRFAIGAQVNQVLPHRFGHRHRFARLTRFGNQNVDVHVRLQQTVPHRLRVREFDMFVGDYDRILGVTPRPDKTTCTTQIAGSNFNIVGPFAEINVNDRLVRIHSEFLNDNWCQTPTGQRSEGFVIHET